MLSLFRVQDLKDFLNNLDIDKETKYIENHPNKIFSYNQFTDPFLKIIDNRYWNVSYQYRNDKLSIVNRNSLIKRLHDEQYKNILTSNKHNNILLDIAVVLENQKIDNIINQLKRSHKVYLWGIDENASRQHSKLIYKKLRNKDLLYILNNFNKERVLNYE